MIKRFLLLALLAWLMLTVAGVMAQDTLPDSDGDTVPDDFDSCATEPGIISNNGCPEGVLADFDKDGIADFDDYCFGLAGVIEYGGCPEGGFPDSDADDIPDFFDACFNEAGLKENSGCPEGVVPDFDGDTIPDPQDQCPRQYGDPSNNGCILDADGDNTPDEYDFCPDVAGLPERVGCPADFALPDGDADGIEDPFDGCPADAGPQETGGCPDADGDTVADLYDLCPAESGDPIVAGCVPIETATLPATRAVLDATTLPSVGALAQLRLNSYILGLTADNKLYLQSAQEVLRYDLNNPELLSETIGEPVNGQVVISQQGNLAAFSGYGFETGIPYIHLWDMTSNSAIVEIAVPPQGFNSIAISNDGSLVATSHFADSFSATPDQPGFNGVRLWNTATGALSAEVPTEEGVIFTIFSADGSKLLALVPSNQLIVIDVASGQSVGGLGGEFSPFIPSLPANISPNGNTVVTLGTNNQIKFYDLASLSETGTLTITEDTQRTIINLLFSPDGALLLVVDATVAFEGPVPADAPPAHVSVVDVATAQVVGGFDLSEQYVSQLYFDATGTLLVQSSNVTISFAGVAQ